MAGPTLPRVIVINDRMIDILKKDQTLNLVCLDAPKRKVEKSCGCKNKKPTIVEVTDYTAISVCLSNSPEQVEKIKKRLNVDRLVIFVTKDGKAERVDL